MKEQHNNIQHIHDYEDSDNDDEYCSEYVESIRSKTGLEIGCRVRWPTATLPSSVVVLELSTCLPEEALAPMFHGTQWAGTRVWRAAIVAIQYLEQQQLQLNSETKLLELGCGLGVPGMVLHGMYGCHTVLTDKSDLIPQLRTNLANNFPNDPTIEAHALDWSASGVAEFFETHNYPHFDVVLNCDCIYEPLYGESWKHLLTCQNELLRRNPATLIYTSCERRRGDGIEDYLAAAAHASEIARIEKVVIPFEHPPEVEIYRFYGKVNESWSS
jgi:hypothetical protein